MPPFTDLRDGESSTGLGRFLILATLGAALWYLVTQYQGAPQGAGPNDCPGGVCPARP